MTKCSNQHCLDGWVDHEVGTQDGRGGYAQQVPCQVCCLHCEGRIICAVDGCGLNAQEIVDELMTGKTVAVLSDDAFEFMREVERHNISCEAIAMSFRGGQCVMTIESYYCPEHKYNPPRHSPYALCPTCEMSAAIIGRLAR
jgi:hypothetical protein